MRTHIITALLSICFCIASLPTAAKTATTSPEQQQKLFIDKVAKKYKLKKADLTRLLSHAHYDASIIKKMTQPFEKKPWNEYRKFFLSSRRINEGVQYWQKHKKILAYAKKKYGVSPSVIVAIVGIETFYGKHKGTYNTLDSLSTLAFHYPARSKFFSHQLSEFILLTKEKHLPILKITGSYAGALGIPQFMPDVYRHYAAGYQNKNHADIMNSHADAVISIANYLKKRGKWRRNQPIAAPCQYQRSISAKLISEKAIPNQRLKQLKKLGITPEYKVDQNLKAAIISLDPRSKKNPQYWLTYNNFRAIMRYNPRIHYAMAVYQLSHKIKKSYEKQYTRKSTTFTSTRKIRSSH